VRSTGGLVCDFGGGGSLSRMEKERDSKASGSRGSIHSSEWVRALKILPWHSYPSCLHYIYVLPFVCPGLYTEFVF